MSYFGFSKYVSPPRSPVEGRKSPVRSPIIPFCTSPSQLNEVSTCADFTFSNSLRSPEGPMRGRSVKEFEEQLSSLKKENFNLKLRIYFLEERMGANFNLDKENIVKNNVELMVEIESLRKEVQEKHELLCQAVKAMDLEEEEYKKVSQNKNDEIQSLKQEIEELKLQLQDGKYDDNESTHQSYHSEPIFFSSQMLPLPESNSKVRMLQEKIASLERELNEEKENSASLKLILDQADAINAKYEELQKESDKKDQTLKLLKDELDATKGNIAKLSFQVRDLEKQREEMKAETQKLTKLLEESTEAAQEMEARFLEMKKKAVIAQQDVDRHTQKYERSKVMNDLKIAELGEDLEKQRRRVQELQKKLGAAHQELKDNQHLLVPKSPKRRSFATNTDCDNVSVSNAAAPLGVPQEDALCDALDVYRSPSKSPVSPKTFDFDIIYRILNAVMFSNKPKLMKQLDVLKEALSKSEQKIKHLKAQEFKACAIIKNLMQYRKTAVEQCETHKKRIADLERELEGVVSRPDGNDTIKENEQLEEVEVERECKALIDELENKIKILELTLKEKDIHIDFIEGKNLELQNNLQVKEADMINLERTMSNQSVNPENAEPIGNSIYSKLFEEKNKEIEKLNEELRKRTHDLQAVVNNELWQKNREIEKLQIKYGQLLESKEKEMTELRESFSTLSMNLEELKAENEDKHVENSNLKINNSDLKLQLQLLKDKISEVGLISDDKLEVEIIISSLDDMKRIQQELEEVKNDKEMLIEKIRDLEELAQNTDRDVVASGDSEEVEKLKHLLEISEALRTQTNGACQILRAQLEELAIFLDSLMKQKSVLGFLGVGQKKLREAIDHSLDLSKSLNITLGMNPDQSLMQLSNITALLNCSNLSNVTMNEESNRYSFSILPEQATLTYQSNGFRIPDEKLDQSSYFTVKTLRDEIEMLQSELRMKNMELGKYRRESRSGKELKMSHSKPRLSPNKLKNNLTIRNQKVDSESDSWSEPDKNVSKARIGLFKNDADFVTGVEEMVSSDSTDESLTDLNRRRSDILNECQLTITKLNKQVQDLQTRLKEKDRNFTEQQEINTQNMLTATKDIECLRKQLEEVESKLQVAETQKEEIGQQVKDLERSKNESLEKSEMNNKDLCNKINQLKAEREQIVNLAKEYAAMTENSRQEIMVLEKRITELTIDKENLDKKLKRECEKVKDIEEQFKEMVMDSNRKVEELNRRIFEITKEYSENYVEKCVVEARLEEIEKLSTELNTVKESFNKCKKAVEMSGDDEKKMKDEINNLQTKLSQISSQYSEALLEKSKLEQELNDMRNRRMELQIQLDDVQQELALMKDNHYKEINHLQNYKSKLELKMSELELSNADLRNRLARANEDVGNYYSNSLPSNPAHFMELRSKPIPGHLVSEYIRQNSNSSQSYLSEDEMRSRGIFSVVVPQKSVDTERNEANSSPDLGIESDQGRFSSLEVQTQVPRPLLQTIEITENMSNLLDGDNNSVQGYLCDNKSCHEKSIELVQENNILKKKLIKTRKALEDTVTQLTLANQRKKQVEKNICRQIHKTSQVLREAKANLDSGSEVDLHKK